MVVQVVDLDVVQDGAVQRQLDVRAGWRRKVRSDRALELFLDIYNITDRANFDNPVSANADRRLTTNFLVLTNLRGGGGFPA